jgi:hypothetical protein
MKRAFCSFSIATILTGLSFSHEPLPFALRRRAEKLEIKRSVENDLLTRSIYVHYSIKDLEFIEKGKEAKQGGKGHG